MAEKVELISKKCSHRLARSRTSPSHGENWGSNPHGSGSSIFMVKADIGIVGLAVMGQNLALNIADHGSTVAVFNRTLSKTDEFLSNIGSVGEAQKKKIIPTHSYEEFVASLAAPRKILLMVKAGSAVDDTIAQLVPLLDAGDIIIDGGNSYFSDTRRRMEELKRRGFLFVGTGISGGEEGARHGPSIMPGGSAVAWPHIKDLFQKIAAKAGPRHDIPCCEWVGPDGAGHYVKMVHNGIEYADMQLICEAYFLMKMLLGMTPPEMHEVFSQWNQGRLRSYLIEITADILQKKDPATRLFLIDSIRDAAGQKGTGKLTTQNALDLGVPAPTLAEAVIARSMSALKDERVSASAVLPGPKRSKKSFVKRAELLEKIHDALYASKIVAYAQGFALLKEASLEYGWNLNFGSIALLWREGCIIRAQFLEDIKKAYDEDPALKNLLRAPYFCDAISHTQNNWRDVVSAAVQHGIAAPAFSSALAYYDAYRSAALPANLLQAQRDYFGAHTYERIDTPGTFHTDWQHI